MSKIGLWYVAGAGCCIAVICLFFVTDKRKPPKEIGVAGRQLAELRHRRIYPYSVISGGVESGAELRTALLSDSVAAEHYAGFHVERAQAITLDRPRRAYVSYRKGNRIYWTQTA